MPKCFSVPDATSPLETWLSYLEQLHVQSIDMGLDRVGAVARKMTLVTPAPLVITVTGTNGKGTTCHTLESIFLAAGLKVGVYSSPHLVRYTERVRILGKEPTEAEFCHAFAQIEAQREATSLTYFEFGTLAALWLFKAAELDVVILEVGLGGRLDATNIVDSTITAITSIALDHMDWLGHSREQIGYEKAGIFRPHCYAVIGEPDMPDTVAQLAKSLGTSLYRRGVDWTFSVENNEWNWVSSDTVFSALPIPNVPVANAATALGIIACLRREQNSIAEKITDEVLCQGLRTAQLPGRFQVIKQSPLVILDVAHNPHAAEYLAEKLAQLPRQTTTQVRAVFGMLADKDIKGTLQYLSPQVTTWYIAPLFEPRGARVEQLASYLPGATQYDCVEKAWAQALSESSKEDIIVVCGSFHTVAHVLALCEKEE